MKQAKFSIGQCIEHRLFEYRGVIVDVDAEFRAAGKWRLQKTAGAAYGGEPWYHVLVDNSGNEAYVPERNLVVDDSGEPINHPLLSEFLVQSDQGYCQNVQQLN